MSNPISDIYFIPVAHRKLGGIHHGKLRIYFLSVFCSKKVITS